MNKGSNLNGKTVSKDMNTLNSNTEDTKTKSKAKPTGK